MNPIGAVAERNREMKERVAARGYRLSDVFEARPHAPSQEGAQLAELLRWMEAWESCPDRRMLERRGFHFPPVEPGMDPDTDWLRFERWMRHEPLQWKFTDEFGPVAGPDGLSDEQVEDELGRVARLLEARGVLMDLREGVPPRLALQYLARTLAQTGFEITGTGSWWHLDGCHGFCPDCFQRPWCDVGACSKWPEDEEAAGGARLVPPEAAAFAGHGFVAA